MGHTPVDGGVADETSTDRGGAPPSSGGTGGVPDETSAGRGGGGASAHACIEANGGAYCAGNHQ
ncbi:MAG: hypothetical protein JW940_34815 [Polyangiaceae bacterium]|nr:hypothetical protein [Polyangiaceae bacterium]